MVKCPYCSEDAELVSGERIYPHLPELHHRWFWLCAPCGAYVGCHDESNRPLGRLANRELRIAKMAAHASFDPLWRGQGRKVRRAAYRWLAERLGIHPADCHIGMFNEEQCRRTVDVIRSQTFRYVPHAERAISTAASAAHKT